MSTPVTRRVAGACGALVSALVLALALASGAAAAPGCLWPPVDAPITDHFRAPNCPYCAGNRGLEYVVAPGTAVRAMAAGTVTFAGDVAGTRYLVVEHTDGRLATYGRLDEIQVARGSAVLAGAVVATTTAALYVGLREGDVYLDPEPLIGRLRRRARLVPLDGTPARPPEPPTLTCADPAGPVDDAGR